MGRLQQERSAETKQRLMEATVACLNERGYANLTTAEVAARAGVSKGAQLYHFPKKDDLVVAALEYLFAQRLDASREAIRNLPAEKNERVAAVIDVLWPVYTGPTFYAWLELVIASRTDVALREAVARTTARFSREVRQTWREAFGRPTDDPEQFLPLDSAINGLLASMAIGRVLAEQDGGATDRNHTEMLGWLKRIGNFLLQSIEAQRRVV